MIFDKNIVTTLVIIFIMAGSNAIKTHRKSTHIHLQNKTLRVFGGNCITSEKMKPIRFSKTFVAVRNINVTDNILKILINLI